MELSELLAPGWDELTTYHIDGQTYYLACRVISLLSIRNVTNAMRRRNPTPRISHNNWIIQLLPEVNKRRGVYLFTYDGIVEIIRNNFNTRCNELKLLLDE